MKRLLILAAIGMIPLTGCASPFGQPLSHSSPLPHTQAAAAPQPRNQFQGQARAQGQPRVAAHARSPVTPPSRLAGHPMAPPQLWGGARNYDAAPRPTKHRPVSFSSGNC